jgi:hypothetical protein
VLFGKINFNNLNEKCDPIKNNLSPLKQITEVSFKLLLLFERVLELNDLPKIEKVNKPSMSLNQL